jgi:hypothetical protein
MNEIETNKTKICAALVKAQKEFSPALKDSNNPHYKTKYADLSSCVKAVIDGLNNNGIFLTQRHHNNPNGISIETILVHESGETLSSGILFVPADKQTPQGYGSALTYARRYSLMTMCGIAPEDDDGNSAEKKSEQNKVTTIDVTPIKSIQQKPALTQNNSKAYEIPVGFLKGNLITEISDQQLKEQIDFWSSKINKDGKQFVIEAEKELKRRNPQSEIQF